MSQDKQVTSSSSSKEEKKHKVALITGVTGQDGSYLAEFLLEKDYIVHGIIRRSSSFNTGRVEHLYVDRHFGQPSLILHYGDMTDSTNLNSLLASVRPDEIYNLAAQSHVQVSFELPQYTADVDAVGVLRLLEAMRSCGLTKTSRFYQASTSELYGKQEKGKPQSEKTPFYPRSPYAVAKQFGFWITLNYREAYDMFATNGILFNHESPRRGPTFVTRKTTRAVARIHKGLEKCLYLGNLDAMRDWGHAKDYVEAMWLMLQAKHPDDYVVSSGKTISVRKWVEMSFAAVGMKITWKGTGVDEIGVDQNGETRVKIDPKYFRPTEVEYLHGDPSKIQKELGWKQKYDVETLCTEMVSHDVEEAERELVQKREEEERKKKAKK